MGTGSEVQLCVQVYEQLAADGICSLLSPEVDARVAVEARTGLGWREYVGFKGHVVARYDFGASAPIKDLLKHFGFTADRVAAEARSLVGR